MGVNSSDPQEHNEIFLSNIAQILDYFRSIHFDEGIMSQIYTFIRDNNDKIFSEEGRELSAELLKNIGSIFPLLQANYPFHDFQGNILDLYSEAQKYLSGISADRPTEISYEFPDFVQDALTSLDSKGQEPPKAKLSTFTDYFANILASITSEVEGTPVSEEQRALFTAIDEARGRIGKKLSQGLIDGNASYLLNSAIDEIMNSKKDIPNKIEEIQKIAR